MDWLMKSGCENVIELDWWEENCVPGYDDITFVCTPSQHWSKRTALDYNKVLHLCQGYYNTPPVLVILLIPTLCSVVFVGQLVCSGPTPSILLCWRHRVLPGLPGDRSEVWAL